MMHFDTAVLPVAERFPRFAAASPSYRIEVLGDPAAFAAQCVAWRLGDVNIMRARISPVRYRRLPEQIERDGADRLVLFHLTAGRSEGVLDGQPLALGAGDTMLWDLARPLDIGSPDGVETEAVTLPRFLLDDVLPGATWSGRLAASPALTLLLSHLRFLLDHADDVPAAAHAFQGRALRDLIVAAHDPAGRARTADDRTVPLLQRLLERIDRAPATDWTLPALAAQLGSTPALLTALVDRFGGVEAVVERRRLLAAYRMLGDPAESAAISVIAARCGFTNMPRFSRQFNAAFRTSPRDLRVHHRAELPDWAGAHHLDRAYAAILTG